MDAILILEYSNKSIYIGVAPQNVLNCATNYFFGTPVSSIIIQIGDWNKSEQPEIEWRWNQI